MNTVLVTGSRGFIGSRLVSALIASGRFERVIGMTRGRYNRNERSQFCAEYGVLHEEMCGYVDADFSARHFMEYYRPTAVFHLAGDPSVRMTEYDSHGHQKCRDNILGTQNLLAYAPKGCRFVLASSAAVYGDVANYPEVAAAEWWQTRPSSLYGATKSCAETLVSTYTTMGRVEGVILRYVANVGAGATHGLLRDIIFKLRSDSETLELLGEKPGSIKPYMHVDDTVAGTIHFGLEEPWRHPAVFNIAGQDSISVGGIASMVMAIMGVRKRVTWLGKDSTWAGDNAAVYVNNQKVTTLGWRPTYPASIEAVAAATKEILACQQPS